MAFDLRKLLESTFGGQSPSPAPAAKPVAVFKPQVQRAGFTPQPATFTPSQPKPVAPAAPSLGDMLRGALGIAGGVAHSIIDPIAHTAAAVSATPLGAVLPGGRPQDHIESIARQINNPTAQAAFRAKAYNDLLGQAGFALNDSPTDIGRKFVANTAQTALTALAPGVDNVISKGVEAVVPQVLPRIVPKVVSGVATGTAIGGPFNTAAYLADAQHPTLSSAVDMYKQGALAGGALGGATPLIGAVARATVPKIVQFAREQVPAVSADHAPATAAPEPVPRIDRTKLTGKQLDVSSEELAANANRPLPPEPAAPAPAAVPAAKAQQTKFSKSVIASPEVSPELQAAVQRDPALYETTSNKAHLAASDAYIKQRGATKAQSDVMDRLSVPAGKIDHQTVSDAIATAKALDARAKGSDLQNATDIYNSLAEHLSKQGQAVQAASLLSNRTPEGLRYQIAKTFKRAGVTPSKAVSDQINAALDQVKATEAGTNERILATKELQKVVADNLPSSLTDKITSFWKAGLLTGARTQTGNILSNETFSVLHNISNPLAAGLDKAASLVTGERTKALTGRGLVSGTAEGVQRAGQYLKSGIDERAPLTNKFDTGQVNFKNKALNTYVNGVFRLMGAADRPHYYRQLQNSLYDLATADGVNKGLRGAELKAHVESFVKNPPDAAFQTATNEAEKAVLGNDTILSRAVARMRQVAEDAESPIGKAVTEATINFVAPFTKVPSAFISRVIDYTPVGALKTAVGQISRGKFDQRALVTALSEATTGTGLMYLGKKLADANLLTGNYPTDPKEQARWKADGIQPNAVRVGNQWLSMNYLGPVGLLFNMGKRIADAEQAGADFVGQQAQAYGGTLKDLTGQSFLQGLNNGIQAINEPGRYAENFIKSQAGSIVPTLSNDIAIATDAFQRQANGVGDAIKSRIPGARETLNPAQDVYGNPLPRKTSPLNTLVNPMRPSDMLTNDVKAEVDRLYNADPQNKDLAVTPTPLDKTVSLNGARVPLSDQQRYALQQQVGQTTQSAWSQLIQTPEYKALSDVDKAQALNKLRTDVTALTTRQFVTDNGLGVITKKLTTRQAGLTAGTVGIADYAKSPGATSKAAKSTKTPAKKAASGSKGSSSRRSSGGRSSNGLSYKLFAYKDPSSYNKTLRDLLAAAKVA